MLGHEWVPPPPSSSQERLRPWVHNSWQSPTTAATCHHGRTLQHNTRHLMVLPAQPRHVAPRWLLLLLLPMAQLPALARRATAHAPAHVHRKQLPQSSPASWCLRCPGCRLQARGPLPAGPAACPAWPPRLACCLPTLRILAGAVAAAAAVAAATALNSTSLVVQPEHLANAVQAVVLVVLRGEAVCVGVP